jgi:hypothetical protein
MKKQPKDYVENKLKPPKAFFEWCYYWLPTYKWTNKNKTIIASDKKHNFCYEKKLVKNSRLTFFAKKDFFQIVLSSRKRIEIQTYEVWSKVTNGKQTFGESLVNLEILSGDKHIKVSEDLMGEYKFGLKSVTGMFNYMKPSVYENNWKERLSKISELKYVALWNICPEELPKLYKYRKEIEFAQKIGAYQLARDIGSTWVNREIDMRVVTQKWLKKNKQFLANSNRGLSEVRLKEKIESMGAKMVLGIEDYLSLSQINKIPSEVGLVKFQNYLIKQDCTFSYYSDYRSLLNDLKIIPTKSQLLPKNLVEAHNKAVDTLNAKKRELETAGFKERAEKLKQLELTVDKFVFIVPKTADDLVQEGQKLHHCVGGSNYIKKHAKGETTIIFVREKSQPKQPLYTIEFKDNQIVQFRGERNVTASDSAKIASEKWLREVKGRVSRMGERYNGKI